MKIKQWEQYFLIDDTVRSAKEFLSATVKRDRLGTLVGSTTQGAYLLSRASRLFEGKYFLLVPIADELDFGDIEGIEGIGVDPDVFVEPCHTFCSGSDPILNRAIELIRD
jgi:C-terminal processing protease CtpA/Prc